MLILPFALHDLQDLLQLRSSEGQVIHQWCGQSMHWHVTSCWSRRLDIEVVITLICLGTATRDAHVLFTTLGSSDWAEDVLRRRGWEGWKTYSLSWGGWGCWEIQSCFSPAQRLGFDTLLPFFIIRFWIWTFLFQYHMPFACLCVLTLAWELGEWG